MYVHIYLCRLQMEHSRIIDDILKQQTPNRREITKKRSAEEALTNAAQRDIGSIFKVHFIIHTLHTYIHLGSTVVADMMAGVGPFAVPLAMANHNAEVSITVHANG